VHNVAGRGGLTHDAASRAAALIGRTSFQGLARAIVHVEKEGACAHVTQRMASEGPVGRRARFDQLELLSVSNRMCTPLSTLLRLRYKWCTTAWSAWHSAADIGVPKKDCQVAFFAAIQRASDVLVPR
jgi:hypothetical protein